MKVIVILIVLGLAWGSKKFNTNVTKEFSFNVEIQDPYDLDNDAKEEEENDKDYVI